MPSASASSRVRHLVVVLGDQLDRNAAVFDDFDPAQDRIWMAEAASEATVVWSHQARIALFLSAMRHFRDALRRRGWTVEYRALDDDGHSGTLAGELAAALRTLQPERVRATLPGEHRVLGLLRDAATHAGTPLDILPDRHFLCSPEAFAAWAADRKELRMEYFYRLMRREHGVLLEPDGGPVGGKWNFDADNREAFDPEGPPAVPPPVGFRPDTVTREVLRLVADRFGDHPGRLDAFDWPVTRRQALRALRDFVAHRLPDFGRWQDAMWLRDPAHSPWLFHSRLSAALNLKLLDPREVIAAAVTAWQEGAAPLASVEGFVRQILGWREYVRGVYWQFMPEYLDRNALAADRALPAFYWTGETDMVCLREAIGQTLDTGHAHHIQRLMVTGLYALLLGVHPAELHRWYLAVYVDAVEWVELPNTLGMSQYADGGVMASKPYAASGRYIARMSNYCEVCRFRPGQAEGPDACPLTTLYWDFLARHRDRLAGNRRMAFQLANLRRKPADELARIRKAARRIRNEIPPRPSRD